MLTGHHFNDQCETFFLSLKRGSGPTGLSCMSFDTPFGNKNILRPFLNITKKKIALWAKKNKLKWIEDFSNYDIHHDRNFIRNKIFPMLEKRWPYFMKNCFRTINICQKETKLLDYFLHKKIHPFIKFDGSLRISEFSNMKQDMCTALIRHWIGLKNIKIPSYDSVQNIYHQMIFSRNDANPKIILHNKEIRRYKKTLYFIKTQPSIKNTLLFWHDTKNSLKLPNSLGYLIQNQNGTVLPAPNANELINIRFQHEGKITVVGRKKSRKIKKIWQERNIPPWSRSQIPLIFYNDTFITALGVFIIKLNNTNKNYWIISWVHDLNVSEKNFFSFY